MGTARPATSTAGEAGATTTVVATDDWYARIGKRVLDVAVASLLLAAVAPLLLVLMAIVAAATGEPALYRQARVGRNGREFTLLKLRTMTGEAPDLVAGNGYSRWEQIQQDGTARVTAVGRWLRLWSLDELPQLINVVRGDMSLVGPRPVLPMFLDAYGSHSHARHRVRPGLTGPWQVSPHRDKAIVLYADYDLDYAANVKLRQDLGLLMATIPAVLGLRGGPRGS